MIDKQPHQTSPGLVFVLYCLVLVGLLFIFALSKAFLYFQPPFSNHHFLGTFLELTPCHNCIYPFLNQHVPIHTVRYGPWLCSFIGGRGTQRPGTQCGRHGGPRGLGERVVVAASWNTHIPKKIGLKRKILSLIRLSFPMIFLCIVKVNYEGHEVLM